MTSVQEPHGEEGPGIPGTGQEPGPERGSGAAPGTRPEAGARRGPESGALHGPEPEVVRRTRLGGLWIVLSLGAAVLVLLLVFVLQNDQRVEIHIYGGHWTAPLGVALLMAAALGVLLVVVPGGGRILQLKRAARRLHREREVLIGRLDGGPREPLPARREPLPEQREPLPEGADAVVPEPGGTEPA